VEGLKKRHTNLILVIQSLDHDLNTGKVKMVKKSLLQALRVYSLRFPDFMTVST
jgi:hypothetical protein